MPSTLFKLCCIVMTYFFFLLDSQFPYLELLLINKLILMIYTCRNTFSKVYLTIYIDNITRLAFDDITPEDPDFP
jgi:hypothetical protein